MLSVDFAVLHQEITRIYFTLWNYSLPYIIISCLHQLVILLKTSQAFSTVSVCFPPFF